MSQLFFVDGPIYREDIIKYAVYLEEKELSKRITQMQSKNENFTKLLYSGRSPRKDVLLKLKEIAFGIEIHHEYPFLILPAVKAIIKEKLASPDPRTESKYVQCINSWLNIKGQKLSFRDTCDFTGFKDVILKNLEGAQ